MASLNHFANMYDVKLKPRLLRLLTDEYLPDGTVPVPTPPELSYVVHAIKNFGLLSESFPELSESKLVEDWKSSVNVWFDRMLSLVSSDSTVNCWVGTSLLGVTCLECSSNRFLASYPIWLDKLLSHIEQPPSDSEFVKAASCASISDVFTRLGGYSNVKREGISHVGKFIQPVLNLLNEDSSEALLEGAVSLLCTIITFFPSSIHHDYETAEAAIVSKIMSRKYSVNMLKKYAHCLALLPKSRGDEDSWSLMMQKLLISINVNLTDAFTGLREAVKFLVPPGKDPSTSLANHSESSGQASQKSGRLLVGSLAKSRQLLTNRVPALMLCCCAMLATPYHVEVTVPIDPLLAVIWRVLMVDGSLYQPLSPLMTVVQQQHTCNELSILHLYSLDLLAAVIKGVRRQLWPHTAEIVSLLTAYFRRSALAKLRIKVYSIIRILLISMGVGIALSIDQEVISNAFVDLEYNAYEKQRASSSANSISEASWQPSHKKRKHVTTIGSLEEPVDEEGLDAVTKNNLNSPIPLKIAALKALEVLLTVGGALSSEYWRSSVDCLLISVATNACDGKMIRDEQSVFEPANEHSSTREHFQLAALHALLASLLSPTRVRPRYLFRGLELFHKGKQMTGTKIAEICAHALLALELHMHPRHLPVVDFPSPIHGSFNERFNCEVSENICSTGQENDAPLSTPPGMDNSDGNDDSCSWVHNGNESDDPPSNRNENINTEEPSNADVQQTIKDFQAETLHMDGLSRVVIPEGSQHGQAVSADAKMVNSHEIMARPGQFQDPISIQSVEVRTGSSAGSDVELGKVVGDNSAFDPPTPSNILASCNDVLGDADDGSNISNEIGKNLISKGPSHSY